MAFIYERIPENVLKSFDFSVFKGFNGSPMGVDPMLRWTRDEDRDAFLIATDAGGGPHVGAPREVKFGFWWKGNVIHFQGNEVYSRDDECHVLIWENPRVNISSNLTPRRTEFLALLKEALIAKGSFINSVNPKNSTKVIVNLV